jgi:carboxyl-terminal processing protease
MKIKLYKILNYFFIILFFALIGSASTKDPNSELLDKIDLFGEVLEKIENQYVDEVEKSEVMDSAINGVLQSLDPYSAYMSPELFSSMQTETKGEFGGLGIEISMEAGVVKVISPIDDTPAAKAGIKAGDYIIKINDVQVQGKTLMEAVSLMRGPAGSSIELTIRRKNFKKAKKFIIKRDIIEIKSVSSQIIKNKIGYL